MRLARTFIEVGAVVLGGWLGGPVGVGTLIFAVAIGPAVQLAFRLLRVSPLFDLSPWLSAAVVAIGLVTAIVAHLAGSVQTDIKSALSFASLVQVGIIVAEIGLGQNWRDIK